MSTILRNPLVAAKETYDLLVIGGGFYGVMLSWEASLRGLRTLLIEQADFGGATSFNSLKTIHGGFRYLQNLDLKRFFESVDERNWFLQSFSDPNLVKPLPCLLPLYGQGLRRPFILQQALQLNSILAARCDRHISVERRLPRGKIISAQRTQEIFSSVNPEGLQGGAIWYDAFLPNSQRLLIQILKAACSLGATALNYMQAKALRVSENRVSGLVAQDADSGQSYEYRAKNVVNAAGPWSAEVALTLDVNYCNLYQNCLAWNILFDREAVSDFAVAIAPNRNKTKTYFFHNWKGRLLVGTGNAPWGDKLTEPMPSDAQLEDFITDLNDAVPRLKLSFNDITQVLAGFRPVKTSQTIAVADRELIINHEQYGGPRGLYSIAGVKFTTARLVAEKTLQRIFTDLSIAQPQATVSQILGEISQQVGIFAYDWYPNLKEFDCQQQIKKIIAEESVQHLDDLIFRRTSLGDNPSRTRAIAKSICQLFNWDAKRSQQELLRVENYLASREVKPKSIYLCT